MNDRGRESYEVLIALYISETREKYNLLTCCRENGE